MKTETKRELFHKFLHWGADGCAGCWLQLRMAGKRSQVTVLAKRYRYGRKMLWDVHSETRGEKLLS